MSAARAQRAAAGERLIDRAVALLRQERRAMTAEEIAAALHANPKSVATLLGTVAKGNRSVVRRVPAFVARPCP
jgi:DNA-binding CsgD family transcriptional regulator